MALQLIRDSIETSTTTQAERDLLQLRDSEPFAADDRREDIDTILAFQRDDGSFSLCSDYRVDADYRVAYVYRPTYWCCQILMKTVLSGEGDSRIERALAKGLDFSCGRNLEGHGFEGLQQQVEDLQDFIDCGLVRFLEEHPECSTKFTKLVRDIVNDYKKRLDAGETTVPFSGDVADGMRKIVGAFE